MQVAEPLISERVAPAVLTIALQGLLIYLLAAGLGVVPKTAPPPDTQAFNVPIDEPTPTEPDKIDFDARSLATSQSPDIATSLPVIPIEHDRETETDYKTSEPGGAEIIEPQFYAPRLVQSFEPPYPGPSILQAEEGVVQVRVTIGPNGEVGDASIEKSSGFTRLDQAALKAVRRWRFAPAMRGSEAMVGSKVVAVRFLLKK